MRVRWLALCPPPTRPGLKLSPSYSCWPHIVSRCQTAFSCFSFPFLSVVTLVSFPDRYFFVLFGDGENFFRRHQIKNEKIAVWERDYSHSGNARLSLIGSASGIYSYVLYNRIPLCRIKTSVNNPNPHFHIIVRVKLIHPVGSRDHI